MGLTVASADNDEDLKQRTGLLPSLIDEEDSVADAFQPFVIDDNVTLPSAVDWVASGAVSSVKDQGRCGW